MLKSQLDKMEVLLARESRNRADLERSMRRDLLEASLLSETQDVTTGKDRGQQIMNNTSVLSDIPIMGISNAIFDSSFQEATQKNSAKSLRPSTPLSKRSERSRIEEATEKIKQKILERGWELGGL